MKIKLKKRDAKVIRTFLGRTSNCNVIEFCEELGLKNGGEIDESLFALYKALEIVPKDID